MAIFLLSAIVVRFVFVGILDQQRTEQLEDVARAGLRSVLFLGDNLKIDEKEISNSALLARGQGLEWFDRRGRVLGAEGLTPGSGSRAFPSVTIPILNPARSSASAPSGQANPTNRSARKFATSIRGC